MPASHRTTPTERRAHERVALAASARLTDGRADANVQVRDLSMGGLGAVGEPAFEVGSRVDVELELDGARIRAPGQVVTGSGGFGVRFTELDQRALTRLLHAVSRERASI